MALATLYQQNGTPETAEAMEALIGSLTYAKCGLGFLHLVVWLGYFVACDGQVYPSFFVLFVAVSCWMDALACAFVPRKREVVSAADEGSVGLQSESFTRLKEVSAGGGGGADNPLDGTPGTVTGIVIVP